MVSPQPGAPRERRRRRGAGGGAAPAPSPARPGPLPRAGQPGHRPEPRPGARPLQILICQNLRNNLQHPNEYIRGVTLRFLCRIREEEILEPLVPSILANLEHRHSYVRKNTVAAIDAIYKLPKGELLLQDAPEAIEKFLQHEQDLSSKRNAFTMLVNHAHERAIRYLFDNIEAIANWGDILQMSVLELIRKVRAAGAAGGQAMRRRPQAARAGGPACPSCGGGGGCRQKRLGRQPAGSRCLCSVTDPPPPSRPAPTGVPPAPGGQGQVHQDHPGAAAEHQHCRGLRVRRHAGGAEPGAHRHQGGCQLLLPAAGVSERQQRQADRARQAAGGRRAPARERCGSSSDAWRGALAAHVLACIC
jgi:hypothetical protein